MAPSETAERPTRYFTVAEANAALGRLTAQFGRVMQLRAQLKPLHASFVEAGVRPTLEFARGLDSEQEADSTPTLQRDAALFHALVDTLNEELEAIVEAGVIIKDVEVGLCDFVAQHHGREVLLCWQLGEPEVGYFHEFEAGFAGRRPIAELAAATGAEPIA